jgi:hypothetical protein
MANQEQPTRADGWEFRLVNDHLLMTSQRDPTTQIQLSAQAAFALLSYLSGHRDALYWLAQQGQREEPEPDWQREPNTEEEESQL